MGPLRVRTAAALGIILLAPAAAVPADARSTTARYRLTAEFAAEDVWTTTEGETENMVGRSRQRATYRARSTGTFAVHRMTTRAGARFRFATRMRGEFTWTGSGWGGVGSTPAGGCVYRWTEEVWPDKTGLSGRVSMDPRPAARASILMTTDEQGRVGTIRYHPDARCENSERPFSASSLGLINLPAQRTAAIDMRRRFGRSFTVRYHPGALSDRPNVKRGDTTGEYDFRWSLRFTRVR